MITPQDREAAKWTPELCDLVNALREFEAAHKAWMNLSVFTPEGEAAKQYKNSCGARYAEARRVWEKSIAWAKNPAWDSATHGIDFGVQTGVHPIFQPILDHYSCSRADQELVDAAAVCHVCERQKRAIREALYWLDVGCMERATESLKRALP